jgi:hypothetical protein
MCIIIEARLEGQLGAMAGGAQKQNQLVAGFGSNYIGSQKMSCKIILLQ